MSSLSGSSGYSSGRASVVANMGSLTEPNTGSANMGTAMASNMNNLAVYAIVLRLRRENNLIISRNGMHKIKSNATSTEENVGTEGENVHENAKV